MKYFFVSLTVFALLAPAASFAFTCPNGQPPGATGCVQSDSTILAGGPAGLVDLMDSIGNWIFTILLALAVVFIVLAAYKYLMSQGGEETGKAHKMLAYAAVAIAVAVLAKGIVAVVEKLVGGSSITTQQGSSQQIQSNTNQNAAASNANKPVRLGFNRPDKAVSFDSEVFTCSDGLTPGVTITYDLNSNRDGFWDNFGGTADNPGTNPNMNGQFVKIGTEHTGIQIGALGGLGDGYDFSAQTCNDGAVPIMAIDKSQNGSWQRITP